MNVRERLCIILMIYFDIHSHQTYALKVETLFFCCGNRSPLKGYSNYMKDFENIIFQLCSKTCFCSLYIYVRLSLTWEWSYN